MSGSLQPRRDRILSAAASEFAQHGFAGARIDRIAATAGVNKQLLFHYFGSKDGLHKAAVAVVLDRFAVTLEPKTTPADGLSLVIGRLLAAVSAHPALLSMLAAPGSSGDSSPETTVIAGDWRGRAAKAAHQVLQDAQRSGHVRDDVDLQAVVEVVVAASLGWAAAGDRATESEAAGRHQFGERLLKLILDYCAWR